MNSVITLSLTHSMMVYRWTRPQLKIGDMAMRNFIWNDDINKCNYGTIAWSHVCAPRKEGGLGVRSIRVANEVYLLKLTWEIITQKDEGLQFIWERHTTTSRQQVRYFISSSIWNGLGRIRDCIWDNVRWIPGYQSKVCFWIDNWLGYIIAEKIGVPKEIWPDLKQKITDFRAVNSWVLDVDFVSRFPAICADIMTIQITSNALDSLVSTKHKSGKVTSQASYNLCRSVFPEVNWGIGFRVNTFRLHGRC